MEGSKPLSLTKQVRRQHSKHGVTRIAELPENRQRIPEGGADTKPSEGCPYSSSRCTPGSASDAPCAPHPKTDLLSAP